MSKDIPTHIKNRMITIAPHIYWDHSVAAITGINGEARCACGYLTHVWNMEAHQQEEIDRIVNLEMSLPDDLQENLDDES